MPSLKDYRLRIASVTSTRKITSAMKMVAASKLRRAQEQAETARPYAQLMGRLLESLASEAQSGVALPRLIAGTGSYDRQLLIVFTSDRGLCAGFNAGIVREVRQHVLTLLSEGKEVSILTVGRKGRDMLRRDFARHLLDGVEGIGKKKLSFADAQRLATKVIARFDAGQADVVTLFYNRFNSVMSQTPTALQLIPQFVPPRQSRLAVAHSVHDYEPSREEILAELLPKNIALQIYRALLESAAGEHGARMAAMDNATRNATDMIRKLTLTYNRARQAAITKELIEIISGAEAIGS